MTPFSDVKSAALLAAALAFPGKQAFCQQPIYTEKQIYEESRIRSIAYSLGQGPLSDPFSVILKEQNQVPFSTDGFVGLSTMIFSDNLAEAFPSHRLPGWHQGMEPATGENYRQYMINRIKGGTWAEYFRYQEASAPFFAGGLDNMGIGNFFSHGSDVYPWTTRSFSSSTVNRGYTKVDYVCPSTCGTSNVSAYYFKLNGWNMGSVATKQYSLPSNLVAADIVNLDAVIHSDGTTHGYIVDNISHLGQKEFQDMTYPAYYGKGGGIYYGQGCINGPCNPKSGTGSLKVYAGASNTVPGGVQYASYRGAHFKFQGGDPFPPPVVPIPYANTSKNRGWVKIEFTNKTVPQPSYAIKSKAVAIGPWEMDLSNQSIIPLSKFGISADRIVGMNTTIQSDPVFNAWNDRPGWQLTDFNMFPHTESRESIPGISESRGGGITMVRDNDVYLAAVKKDANGSWYNYYSANHSQYFENGGSGPAKNRGWVKIDYLAGSCEQGPTGFTVAAIPGIRSGTCTGTAQPFVIEGAGRGTPNLATTDSLTYVYKTANTANRTLTIKVEGQVDADQAGLAGLMFRSSLAANSRNAAMVGTSNNTLGIYFRRRLTDGGQTQVNQLTSVKTPCWLRIKKVGNVFTAYYANSTSNTMPSTFTQLGSPQTISNFPSTYYVGIQVSNYTSPKMNKVTFRGYTETSP